MNLYSVDETGLINIDLHQGQCRARDSTKRFVVILAGTMSGKTSYLPWWLYDEIQRCGSGDYLAVTASYDLFKLKFLKEIRDVFEHVIGWGRYWASSRVIELRDPVSKKFWAQNADDPMWARIILRSAESSAGLESSAVKAAILDEAGMDSFSVETWEAVLRRLSLSQGRVLIGTTVYNLGWLKDRLYDKWEAAGHNHPTIDIIQFDSIENPSFPYQEFIDRSLDMPAWRFDMMYRGRFTRPAGAIYDCFDKAVNTCPRFEIPMSWERGLGLDFGGVNTAGVYFAREPHTGRWFGYREYLHGGRTAKEHASEMLLGEIKRPRAIGGSFSEGQWREEFRAGGLAVSPPDQKDVEVGIQREYGALKRGELIFFDDLVGCIGQHQSYARKLDPQGNPTEIILNKEMFHYCDACRYFSTVHFRNSTSRSGLVVPQVSPAPGVPPPPPGQGHGFGASRRMAKMATLGRLGASPAQGGRGLGRGPGISARH